MSKDPKITQLHKEARFLQPKEFDHEKHAKVNKNLKRLNVGDTLYFITPNGDQSKEGYELELSKIGRKYYIFNSNFGVFAGHRVFKETLAVDGFPDCEIWPSKDHYESSFEIQNTLKQLKDALCGPATRHLTDDDDELVSRIINQLGVWEFL